MLYATVLFALAESCTLCLHRHELRSSSGRWFYAGRMIGLCGVASVFWLGNHFWPSWLWPTPTRTMVFVLQSSQKRTAEEQTWHYFRPYQLDGGPRLLLEQRCAACR